MAGLTGLLGLSLVACQNGEGTQSSQGGAGSQALLEFVSAGQSVMETDAPVAVTLELSLALPADATVTFGVSGTAVDGDDYSVDPGAVVIPAGDVQATVMVTPLVDSECEVTETVVLTLLSVTGAVLGGARVHTVGIVDPDTEVLFESEPNDGVATANVAGATLLGRCVEIRGSIQEGLPDPFDVFEFATAPDVLVSVELCPGSDQMDLLLFVTDAAGALILPAVQSGGAGEPERVTFDVDAALMAEFNLSISSFGPPGDYLMGVTSSALPPVPQTSAGQPWFTDWVELKESLRPGRPLPNPRKGLRPVAFGVQLDLTAGTTRSGALLTEH